MKFYPVSCWRSILCQSVSHSLFYCTVRSRSQLAYSHSGDVSNPTCPNSFFCLIDLGKQASINLEPWSNAVFSTLGDQQSSVISEETKQPNYAAMFCSYLKYTNFSDQIEQQFQNSFSWCNRSDTDSRYMAENVSKSIKKLYFHIQKQILFCFFCLFFLHTRHHGIVTISALANFLFFTFGVIRFFAFILLTCYGWERLTLWWQ